MVPFYNTFVKGFGHMHHIAIIEEVNTFDRILLPIGVSFIEIGPDFGNQISFEFKLLFCLQNLIS